MAEADRKIRKESSENEIGYRPTWTGTNVTRENAKIVPLNPLRQKQFEALIWKLRPDADEPSA